jgi:hypothetical protein
MPYEYNPDHVQEALDLTLGQFWESPRMRELITAFVEQIQEVEDAIEELSTERLLDNAVGQQLDDYGELVGQPRFGLDDTRYKLLIETKIAINASNGEASLLVEALSVLVEADVQYQWRGPACYSATYEGGPMSADFVRFVADAMLLLTPSGVEFELVEVPTLSPGGFRFDTPGQGLDQGRFGRRLV